MKSVGLLDNNPALFIFYFYSNDDPRDQKTDDRTDSRNGDSRNKEVTTATAVSLAFPWCVRLSCNIPGFVSVVLIGENNQVILDKNFIFPLPYMSSLPLLDPIFLQNVKIPSSEETPSIFSFSPSYHFPMQKKKIKM